MIDLSPDNYPLLSRIQSPADLRRLPVDSLPDVCAEIRHLITEQLAVNPGHFASSMGSVELTVALHYVFQTPDDRLVWDVGHQAYGHKLLTGRAAQFDSNRRLGGLSGFPNPAESPYDTFTAGHASNSISAALGMAVGASLDPAARGRHVVAVIGDASIAGGLAFEGLNNASNSGSNILIVLNDNDMSIDPPVGSMSRYLGHLNVNKTYNNFRYKVYRLLRRLNLVSEKGSRRILRFNNSLKALLAGTQNLCEGLNIRYFGPFDGHDVKKLVTVMRDIRDMQGPKILHLRTVKGKGFAPAEADPATWHAPGRFNPVTGERLKGPAGTPAKFQEVMGRTLTELARSNPRIVGITAAMPSGTSMSRMLEEFPERTFDVGISEGHAVTFAGGLAKEGLLPFCAIYSSFLQRGYDHVIHDVAIQGLPVTFCIDRAGLVGEDGVTHHGLFDIAYMRSIPGMTVAVPRDQEMLRQMLYTAQAQPQGPMAIRYPRGSGPCAQWHQPFRLIPRGKGEWLRHSGADAVILAAGPLALRARSVAEALAAEGGPDVAVADVMFVKPLDGDLLREAARRQAPIITVEDGVVAGGMGSAVAEWMAAHGFTPSITMLGVNDTFLTHGTVAQLHALAGIDEEGLRRAILRATAKPTNTNTDQPPTKK